MNNNNKKRCTELIKSPKSMLMNRRANLLRVICPPKRSHVIFFCSGAELNLHLSQPTVLICSSYISNPLFVFPLPASTWKKKTTQMHVDAQTGLTDAILFCSKNTCSNFFTERPRSSAVFKTQRTFDRHAWCFFFFFFPHPLGTDSNNAYLKTSGKGYKLKVEFVKTTLASCIAVTSPPHPVSLLFPE